MINNRPVKIWTDNVEESAMRQIENLTTLPFLFHHLVIMPDVHAGMGMPIGGVLACVDAVIPNAVGVDIGCGMCAVKTNWKVNDIPTDVLRKQIMRGIRKRIPLGMDHHKDAQDEKYLPKGHDIDALEIVKRRMNSIPKREPLSPVKEWSVSSLALRGRLPTSWRVSAIPTHSAPARMVQDVCCHALLPSRRLTWLQK